MKDASTLMVRQIDGVAWKLGRVDPLQRYTSLSELLDRVQEGGMPLEPEADGLLEGGEYDGGYGIGALTPGGRMYFMVQAEALPLLRGYMGAGDYGSMVTRTPRLQHPV